MKDYATDLQCMRMAAAAARDSVPEATRTSPAPKVGVVIAKDGLVLGVSHRGETGEGRHAEFGLLDRLADTDLTGAITYTTLEPCSTRKHPKLPCARWLVDRGIGTVYVASYDPCPSIFRMGWRMLRDAGVICRDFPEGLRHEIEADNKDFLDNFREAKGDRGEAWFDHTQNGGRFRVETSSAGVFETTWGDAGEAVYAYENSRNIAHARYATSFGEIDDPGNNDFGSHVVALREGEVGVYRNEVGYLLVRIVEVTRAESSVGYPSLRFAFEARPRPTA
jgi:pyrimidine deaminase RibD-like protein